MTSATAAAPVPAPLTGALEDYLETILLLVREHQVARVRDIARARGVRPGSVSPALRRLESLGLVRYERREYITLTPAGEQAARRVLGRHEFLMHFFIDVLGMPAAAAEPEACALEHSLSDEGLERLVRFIEFLRVCPARPPGFLATFRDCPLLHHRAAACDQRCARVTPKQASQERRRMSVADLKPTEVGRVVQVNARGAVRQRLLDMGLLPDVSVRLERVAPTGDPLWISLQGTQVALRRREAEAVVIA